MKKNNRQKSSDEWGLKMGAALARLVCHVVRSGYAAVREFVHNCTELLAARADGFQVRAVALQKGIWRDVFVVSIGLTFMSTGAGAAANAVLTPVTPSAEACLPIDMPANDALFAAHKKVFAHYFNRFPLSLDNQDATVDYYSRQYLDPHGEHDKWLAQGGFLRARPLPVPIGQARSTSSKTSRGRSGLHFHAALQGSRLIF